MDTFLYLCSCTTIKAKDYEYRLFLWDSVWHIEWWQEESMYMYFIIWYNFQAFEFLHLCKVNIQDLLSLVRYITCFQLQSLRPQCQSHSQLQEYLWEALQFYSEKQTHKSHTKLRFGFKTWNTGPTYFWSYWDNWNNFVLQYISVKYNG